MRQIWIARAYLASRWRRQAARAAATDKRRRIMASRDAQMQQRDGGRMAEGKRGHGATDLVIELGDVLLGAVLERHGGRVVAEKL